LVILIKGCQRVLRGAAGSRVFRCAGHLAEVIDRRGDAIVAVILIESRKGRHLAVPPQIRPATGRSGWNAKRLETAKVFILGVNLGNVGPTHNLSQEVVSVSQAVRSPQTRFAYVNDLLIEIDHRMVVAVGTLDRAHADAVVRDMVRSPRQTHHAQAH
jgi:hypothetical protein